MAEIKIDVPIIEDAAEKLKAGKSYNKDLSGQEMSEIMKSVIDGILTDQKAVRASVPLMNVDIKNQEGIVRGTVQVESPIKAVVDIRCVLGNSDKEGVLKLVDLEVNEKAGFAAKVALKAVNIENKARNALQNPNKALLQAMDAQLRQKGAKAEEISLSFQENDTLSIALEGSRL